MDTQVQLRGLKQSADGLWYPFQIRVTRPEESLETPQRTERITAIQRRGAGAGNAYRDEEFQLVPGFGIDIVDHRAGIAWHNDPWWPDFSPWLKEKLNWPRSGGFAADPKGRVARRSEEHLSTAEWKLVEAEWKKRAGARPGTARISGMVTLVVSAASEDVDDEGRVQVQAVPCLRLLKGNSPSEWQLIRDRDRMATVVCTRAGNFTLDDLNKGTWLLTFSRRGFVAVERDVVLGDDASVAALDVKLNEDSIRGQVVDAEGQGVGNASVVHRRREKRDPLRPSITTIHQYAPQRVNADKEGRFVFEELSEGMHTIEVSAEGYADTTAEGVTAGARDLKIVLKKTMEQ